MLITSIDEFRLYFPAHAIDNIDPFVGVIDNAEHDFLSEKLGTPLYDALCQWYADNKDTCDKSVTADTTPYNQLLLLCQRCIAYNVMARAIGLHIISINNAGINISTAEDYGKADLTAVDTFKATCVKESHAAINRLLQTLEEWTEQSSPLNADTIPEGQVSGDAIAAPESDAEKKAITDLWRSSRYFYLAASLFIPSARVLQDYLNFYESREKFIQMLPDLHYIQEEIIAPSIGEDLCDYLVARAIDGQGTPTDKKAIHRIRKTMATMLEERTPVLKLDKTRAAHVHDESVRLLQSALDFIANHQSDFPEEVISTSPLYTPPAPSGAQNPSDTQHPSRPVCCDAIATQQKYQNNRPSSAMFVTPILN